MIHFWENAKNEKLPPLRSLDVVRYTFFLFFFRHIMRCGFKELLDIHLFQPCWLCKHHCWSLDVKSRQMLQEIVGYLGELLDHVFLGSFFEIPSITISHSYGKSVFEQVNHLQRVNFQQQTVSHDQRVHPIKSHKSTINHH